MEVSKVVSNDLTGGHNLKLIIMNSGDGQDEGGREGRHPDRVRGEAAAAGGGAGAEEAHRGLQVDQEVQRVQHQQPVDQTPR